MSFRHALLPSPFSRAGRFLSGFLLSGFLLLSLSVTATAPVQAASPTKVVEARVLGSFADWTAYSFQENGGTVCYMVARPQKAEGKTPVRGDIFALITHRPAEKSFNVVSVVSGYSYEDGKDVDIAIAKRTFKMFTQGERAWTRDDKTDLALTDAIRKGGADMIVRGVSAQNAETTDTYSLVGAAKALETIDGACQAPARD